MNKTVVVPAPLVSRPVSHSNATHRQRSACHILDALNFPARLLNRDTVTPELFRFVSGSGRIAIRCVQVTAPLLCVRVL